MCAKSNAVQPLDSISYYRSTPTLPSIVVGAIIYFMDLLLSFESFNLSV